jgi:hypothetical protein
VISVENTKNISPLWLGVQFVLTGVGILVAVKLLQGVPAADLMADPMSLFRGLFSK